MKAPATANPRLTPRLRFPEFRDAEGWAESTLGAESCILKGKGIAKADIDPSGSQQCIRYGELYTDYGEIIEVVNSRTAIPSSNLFLSKAGDVIIPSSGETKIDIATAACVMHNDIALGGDLNVIRSALSGVFLSYYLNGPKRFNIAKVAQGDTVVHLYPSQLEALGIAFPTPPEQHRIASCLSSLDDLIGAESRKLDMLKTHKKGLMQQLFPREGETRPRLRFPEFRDAGGWENRPLGELLSRTPEYGVNAPAVPYSDTLPTYLRITDIDDDGRCLRESKVSVAVAVSDSNYLDEGDIVLARTGASVGKSYLHRSEDGRLVFAGFLIRIRPNVAQIDPVFLSNFLTTSQYWDWVRITSTRSGQPGLNGSEYASLLVPVPPEGTKGILEQHRIASCLSSLDELIAAQAAKIEALKMHKKGLMQQLFPAPEAAV